MSRYLVDKFLRDINHDRALACAHLIDLAQGNRPQRDIEGADLVRHAAEGHAFWLEMLGINE